MARSLSNVKMFSGYFANGITKAIPRRGYAAPAEATRGRETAVSKAAAKGRCNGMVKMRSVVAEEEKTWMPDPKTGFYRPGNSRDEIDAAELRNLILKRKYLCTAVPQ